MVMDCCRITPWPIMFDVITPSWRSDNDLGGPPRCQPGVAGQVTGVRAST